MRRTISPILALALLAGCAPKATVPTPLDPLNRVVTGLNDISIACNSAVKVVIELHTAGTITTEERGSIFSVIRKVVESDDRALTIARSIATLDPTNKANLATILDPVFKEFHAAIDTGLIGIKNQESQRKVAAYLDTISTAVSIVELVLELRR